MANTADTATTSDDRSTHDKATAKHSVIVGVIVVVIFLLVAAVYVGVRYFQSTIQMGPPPNAPVTVAVAEAEEEQWSEQLTAIGTLEAPQGVDVTNEVGGKIVAIEFKSGQSAQEGELLVQLDDSTQQAELRSIKSRLQQAISEAERADDLVRSNAISDEEFEQKETAVENLRAQAAVQEAIIDNKRIEAPFRGVLGIRQVDLGAYLAPGSEIVTLQQIDPIFVNFDLPEQNASVVESGQEVTIRVSAFPEKSFSGTITAINPKVEEATRAFTVQATLENPERKLRPGMFADVTVNLPGERKVITIPQTAVTFNAYGESVFLERTEKPGQDSKASSDQASGDQESGESQPSSQKEGANSANKQANGDGSNESLFVKRSFIETGQRRGLRIEVVDGLAAGQRIVTAGQLKLDDESPITISQRDALQDAKPQPTKP